MNENQLGSRINGGNTAYARNDGDFYPTPPEATIALLRSPFGNMIGCQSVWECACGDGHISAVFEKAGNAVVSTDISDECYGQGGVDFLNEAERRAEWIVTNPPFCLSEAFIRKAKSLGGNCAFLLKSQYWHSKRRLPLFLDFAPAYVMPLTWRPDFLFKTRGGGSPLMDCIWCVWGSSGSSQTLYLPLKKPKQE
ncbi:MAG: SAM-dependent DNA methyltransferase [Clostridiaceae bacterium]